MANLIYKRVSTDQQSTARQNLVLDEAGIEDPMVFEEEAGTSSRCSGSMRSAAAGMSSPSRSRPMGPLVRDRSREDRYHGTTHK
ncbi:hypothetical protein [Streptomyces nigrescens]